MNKEQLTSICKKDCATCDYTGCTMPKEKRITNPLYINGYTSESSIDLSIDEKRQAEKQAYIKEHKKRYRELNTLFSEEYRLKEKMRRAEYRQNNIEKLREYNRQYYKKRLAPQHTQQKQLNPQFLPPCKYDCLNCIKPDCDVGENEYRRNYHKHYRDLHKENLAEKRKAYKAANREILNEKSKEYYYAHRQECLERNKIYREKHQEEQRQYFKEYREKNREKIAEYKKKYRETHREECRTRAREWARKKRAMKKDEFAAV